MATSAGEGLDLGRMRHRVRLESPGAPLTDRDGGFTQAWATLDPPKVWASIIQVGDPRLERRVSETILSQASHVLGMRYHPDLTTQSRVAWTDRSGKEHVANVTDVQDVEEAGIELIVAVMEVVP